MKLLLTSQGITNKKIAKAFLNSINKKTDKIYILMVTSSLENDDQYYVNEVKKELNNIGVAKIDIYRLNKNIATNELNKYDAVYICGGNTFYIYNQMQKYKLDKALINFVNNGGFYIGVSAGSIISGPDIEFAGWGKEADKNNIKLKNTKGLNLVDFVVFPHFKPNLQDELNNFNKKVDYKITPLTDNQAILIANNKKSLIK